MLRPNCLSAAFEQLDSFNRAASGRNGKFTRLFSGRKSSPKTPNKESPAKSDPATPPTQASMSLDDMLIYQPVCDVVLGHEPCCFVAITLSSIALQACKICHCQAYRRNVCSCAGLHTNLFAEAQRRQRQQSSEDVRGRAEVHDRGW
jgi:hypothetical protein